MSIFTKHNPGLRTFPSVSAIGVSLERRRSRGRGRSVKGSAHEMLDRFSVWLLWSTALFVALILALTSPVLVLPWILAGAPISIGVACLIARMVNRDWFTLAVAITYMVSTFSLALVLPW